MKNKYKFESLAFPLIWEAAVRHRGGIRRNPYYKTHPYMAYGCVIYSMSKLNSVVCRDLTFFH